VVLFDYVDNVKFVDEWLFVVFGIDVVFVMVMGYVVFKEFFVDCEILYFCDYVKCYIDLFFLVWFEECDGGFVFGKFIIVVDFLGV